MVLCWVLAEQVMNPSEARTHGAGLLLAESLIGINHGLHSRAAALLPLMLQEDTLVTTDLKVSPTQTSIQLDSGSFPHSLYLLHAEHAQSVSPKPRIVEYLWPGTDFRGCAAGCQGAAQADAECAEGQSGAGEQGCPGQAAAAHSPRPPAGAVGDCPC